MTTETKEKTEPVALAVIQGGGGLAAPVWTEQRVQLVKEQICPKGIGDGEFALFLEQCKRSGLDPLLKEAFCVTRKFNAGTRDKPVWKEKQEFQPSEAGMLARAAKFPDYQGIQAAAVYAKDVIEMDAGTATVSHRFNPAKREGGIVGAWCRLQQANRVAILVWVDFNAYVQQTPLWSKMPGTMIEKCARVAALRKGYPEAFGGLYVKEEMPASEYVEPTPIETTVEPVRETAPAAVTVFPPAAAPAPAPAQTKTETVKEKVQAAASKAQPPAKPKPGEPSIARFGGPMFVGKKLVELKEAQLVRLRDIFEENIAKTEKGTTKAGRAWLPDVKENLEEICMELARREREAEIAKSKQKAEDAEWEPVPAGREPGSDDGDDTGGDDVPF